MTKLQRIIFREGKQVYLRPITKSDLQYLVRWFNDPEITKFLTLRYPMTEAGEEKWIENIGNDKHNFPLMIVLKGKTLALDRPIGTIGIHRLDYENRIAVTGAAIGEKDCWGKGYGTEAKMLLLDFAFNTLNLRKIYSHVLVNNPRSKRYSEKCGYVIEAKLPQHHFRDGTYVDEWILAVYAETWQTLWAKTKKKYLP